MASVVIAIVWLLKPKNEASTYLHQVTLKPVKDVKDETVNILSDIRDELKVEKPEGYAFDLNPNVTDQITELYSQQLHKMPWTSFDLTNNGPSPLYFAINQWNDSQAPIPVGQSIPNLTFGKRDAIKKVFLKCDPGQRTNAILHIIK